MVDGILTKLRNPVNQDLWLTDRFSTSVNHPLSLSLRYRPALERRIMRKSMRERCREGQVQVHWREASDAAPKVALLVKSGEALD